MNVQEIEQKTETLPERARGIAIATAEEYKAAGEFLLEIKALRREIDGTFDPIIEKAHSAHKEAIAQKKKHDGPLAEAEALMKPKIAGYLQEEERKRRAEELRLQEEERKRAEEEQLHQAAILDEIGETEAANRLLDEKPEVIPVILPKQAPKVAGISMRETWSAQVFDLMALVNAVATGKAPVQCLSANTVFLGQQARSMKAAMNYPGVKAVPDSSISAGRR